MLDFWTGYKGKNLIIDPMLNNAVKRFNFVASLMLMMLVFLLLVYVNAQAKNVQLTKENAELHNALKTVAEDTVMYKGLMYNALDICTINKSELLKEDTE